MFKWIGNFVVNFFNFAFRGPEFTLEEFIKEFDRDLDSLSSWLRLRIKWIKINNKGIEEEARLTLVRRYGDCASFAALAYLAVKSWGWSAYYISLQHNDRSKPGHAIVWVNKPNNEHWYLSNGNLHYTNLPMEDILEIFPDYDVFKLRRK